MLRAAAAAVALCLPAAAVAAAGDENAPGVDERGPDAESDDVQHETSITLSPIHLLVSMVELTGEQRLTDKMGVGLIFGGGVPGGHTAIEGGGTFRFYPVGTFVHGMQLGAEVAYLRLIGGGAASGLAADGLAAGGFAGYKIASNVGFTFDAQLGAQYVAASSESRSKSEVGPLLNLNLGWSF